MVELLALKLKVKSAVDVHKNTAPESISIFVVPFAVTEPVTFSTNCLIEPVPFIVRPAKDGESVVLTP